MMGPDVMIFTQNHKTSNIEIPMRLQTAPKKGVIIEDENNATVSWDSDFIGIAYISVAGINECGEGIVSELLAVEVENSLVGIPEMLSGDFTLEVYPNPVTDILTIKVNGENTDGVELKLVNITGSIVRLTRSTDVQSLGIAPGLYLLIAEKGNQRAVQKVLIR